MATAAVAGPEKAPSLAGDHLRCGFGIDSRIHTRTAWPTYRTVGTTCVVGVANDHALFHGLEIETTKRNSNLIFGKYVEERLHSVGLVNTYCRDDS